MSVDTEASHSVATRYLSERGISSATAQKHGVEIEHKPTSDQFRRRLGFDMLPEGKLSDLSSEVIWFPCRDIAGTAVSWIARLLPTIGKIKFLNRTGEAFPFILCETSAAASHAHKPIIITEGPVKALALAQAGQLAIGVGGVWMATSRGSNQHSELVSNLASFEWSGRTAYIAFDADPATNPNVKQALFRTFLVLYRHGAMVRFPVWPLSEGKGIDDYLQGKQAAGDRPAAALQKLLDGAQEVSSLLVAEDLNMVQKELAIAGLTRSQISQITRSLSHSLRVRASALEQDVIGSSPDSNNRKWEPPNPEPWPHLVNGAELLSEIVELLRRHVVMSEEQAVATGLWVMLTYVEAHVDVLPILAVTSPQKRCGKTKLLSILQRLVRKRLPASSITPAALFRSIEKWTPTLVIDEADTFLPENDQLRGVLNAGHTRPMAFVLRTNSETLDPESFSTWAPKAIACIGKLPSTLADRSIEIRMQRRTRAEQIARLRDSKCETFDRLQQQLARWALDDGEKLSAAQPNLPTILNDRAVDNWLPLLAIAELAGDK